MKKAKLTIEQQIEDMKVKGIRFEISSEQDAAKYLRNKCYYFKLKTYEKNFEKYNGTNKKGQYINLDFAFIQELYEIDNEFKSLIVSMVTYVEHALKIRIINDVINNDLEDGYTIVNTYLSEDFTRVKGIHDKAGKSTLTDLIQSHVSKTDNQIDDYAIWEIVEVLSLGAFIDLYQLYYGTYGSSLPTYTSFLIPIKILRNAAAHNNCLLNSIRTPYNITFTATKEIMTIISRIKGITPESRNKWMSNPLINDFIVLVYLYLQVVRDTEKKAHCIQSLNAFLLERVIRNKEFFLKNNSICECYHFVSRVILFFCNKYRK